jgi:predicted transcriptional regulator
MQRMTIHLSDELAERVRRDAKARGQALSTWFGRAAELYITTADPKEQAVIAEYLRAKAKS